MDIERRKMHRVFADYFETLGYKIIYVEDGSQHSVINKGRNKSYIGAFPIGTPFELKSLYPDIVMEKNNRTIVVEIGEINGGLGKVVAYFKSDYKVGAVYHIPKTLPMPIVIVYDFVLMDIIHDFYYKKLKEDYDAINIEKNKFESEAGRYKWFYDTGYLPKDDDEYWNLVNKKYNEVPSEK